MKIQDGEYVFYRNIGICRMVNLVEQCMDGENFIQYYQLKPISDRNSTFYLPVSMAAEKLRPILTKEEVLSLIDSMQDFHSDDRQWTDDRRARKDMYTRAFDSDDYREISHMIIGLYYKKRSLELQGRRISPMDEAAMRRAEGLMLEEFAFVLSMTESELRRFIEERVSS